MVFIVIGTGILFSIIFHVGVKEHPRDCSVEFVTRSCKRSAANWKAWFREPLFYQVLIYLGIFIYVLSSVPSLPNSRFCFFTEGIVAWRDKRGCEGDYSVLDVTKQGNRVRGAENWKRQTKERIGNKVSDRARVQVRFCSHFSFSCSPFPDRHFSNILGAMYRSLYVS